MGIGWYALKIRKSRAFFVRRAAYDLVLDVRLHPRIVQLYWRAPVDVQS